jgi:universal stress protein E
VDTARLTEMLGLHAPEPCTCPRRTDPVVHELPPQGRRGGIPVLPRGTNWVVDYPLDHLWSNTFSDEWTAAYHRQVRAEAADAIRDQLERAGTPAPDTSVQVHLVEGAGIPDEAILEFIQDWGIDLVVMGTVARSGVWGALLGNAAEWLLPELRCSVLAVKPPDFHSPVQAE